MTIDEANTALAIASDKQSRLNAYKLLAQAANEAAFRLHLQMTGDESEGYALQTRLIETRNTLTMAVQHIEETWADGRGHAVPNTLDLAIDHIQAAIEML